MRLMCRTSVRNGCVKGRVKLVCEIDAYKIFVVWIGVQDLLCVEHECVKELCAI